MLELERDTIAVMRAGQETYPPLVRGMTRQDLEHRYPRLNEGQRTAVHQILASPDQLVALEGVAGGGKTTALAAVRDAAERAGYAVEGLAPTSRAARTLADAGVPSDTLQRHLARGETADEGAPRLYVLDESSLASTTQINDFLHRLHSQDRVLFAGDVRRHQAVEAGTPYQQLRRRVAVARLDDIVRQHDPALKRVVESLSRGSARRDRAARPTRGRVHEVTDLPDRLTTIARAPSIPTDAVVSAPPPTQRINQLDPSRDADRGAATVTTSIAVRALVTRQEITGADWQGTAIPLATSCAIPPAAQLGVVRGICAEQVTRR